MNEQQINSKPVFIADSCIGGLSVVKSLWNSTGIHDAVFLADYAVNPLGVKSESAIANVAAKWLAMAEKQADTLIFACNTLSIRYHQMSSANGFVAGVRNIISMVDCFKAMVSEEQQRLANQRVLIIGTTFTASQPIYADILQNFLTNVHVSTVAATELERAIARFQPWNCEQDTVITQNLRQALENTDIAVLACTCFPMARADLESLFPSVQFLDPGEYSHSLLSNGSNGAQKRLSLSVTGDVVSADSVTEFAKSYLGGDFVIS